MKILLINPPCNLKNHDYFVIVPLGLAYIGAVLERDGHKVAILDTIAEDWRNVEFLTNEIYRRGLSWDKIEERIRQYQPDVVGITCPFTLRFKNALEVAKIAKKVSPDIITVMGGMHPSVLPYDVLSHPEIDFVITGEGEYSFLELVNELESNGDHFEKLDGLGFKKDCTVTVNQKKDYIGDLDILPFPARHLLPMEKYFESGTGRDTLTRAQQTSIITSRGCPYRCSFCSIHSVWGPKWRGRSVDNVVDEIEEIVSTYKVKQISFEDDNFAYDKKRAEGILNEILRRKLDILWDAPNGIAVKDLDRNLLQLMKRSGCIGLKLAIESGDPFILHRVMRKPLVLDKIKDTVNWCKELKLYTLAYFVLGMPGETEESVNRSIEFAKSLPLDEVNVYIATPFPGTWLYNECVSKGYLKMSYPDIPAEDMAENYAIIETEHLSTAELQRLQSSFYYEFYKAKIFKNPAYYFTRIVKKPGLVLKYINNAKRSLGTKIKENRKENISVKE